MSFTLISLETNVNYIFISVVSHHFLGIIFGSLGAQGEVQGFKGRPPGLE